MNYLKCFSLPEKLVLCLEEADKYSENFQEPASAELLLKMAGNEHSA